MKPHKVLLFIYSVFFILFVIALTFPKDGIDLGCCQLKFATIDEIFSLPKKKELSESVKKEVKIAEQLIQEAEKTLASDTIPSDTLAEPDKENIAPPKKVEAEELKKNITPIEFANEKARQFFNRFFTKLHQARKKNVRILYYGDSQIEADRITSFIRYKLQSKFGGYGPGMIPPVNFVNFFSIKQAHDDSWNRYSVMQIHKNGIEHNRYGILASFARYQPDTTGQPHTLTFEKARYSYSNTKRFDQLTLYYGHVIDNVVLQVFANDNILDFTTLQQGDFGVYTLSLPKGTEKVELKFSGNTSPDLYAVSFDSHKGVSVDNIAIRGCSGTFFTKIDATHLKKFFDHINIGLIVLEFGGNVMPYLKNEEDCKRYGQHFEAQLRVLKKIAPGIPVLVVGPADMSIKDGTELVTYPLLEKVIEAMKTAAFNQNAGFWNMYQAMGGKNSMPAWVEAGLATTDYTHFTSKGAVVIANMLNNAIMNEYESFLQKK